MWPAPSLPLLCAHPEKWSWKAERKQWESMERIYLRRIANEYDIIHKRKQRFRNVCNDLCVTFEDCHKQIWSNLTSCKTILQLSTSEPEYWSFTHDLNVRYLKLHVTSVSLWTDRLIGAHDIVCPCGLLGTKVQLLITVTCCSATKN